MLIKRIPFEHMQAIFAEGLHTKGSGADRPGIERYVVGSQSRLCIKALCFLRHRREKGHCEPIGKLGVFAVNADFQCMVVNDLYPLKGFCHQIKNVSSEAPASRMARHLASSRFLKSGKPTMRELIVP